jgi:hypothetical protein
MRDWTPRDLGNGVYCSPACGCNCTRAAHDRAAQEGAALVATLGHGWRVRVWENCGWHYRAVRGDGDGPMTLGEVHARTRGSAIGGAWVVEGYSGWLNPRTEGVSQVITDTVADPVEAWGLAMQTARTRLSHFEAELNSLSS